MPRNRLDSDLSDFVADRERVVERHDSLDEANTKTKLIEPFLEVLGWDVSDPLAGARIQLEYSVQDGSTSNKVDYAFLTSRPQAFVGAKSLDKGVNGDAKEQLKSYMKVTDTFWGLLTNGWSYEVYRLNDTESGDRVMAPVADFTVDEVSEYTDELKPLTHDHLQSGASRRLATQFDNLHTGLEFSRPYVALHSLDNASDDLHNNLVSEVSDVLGEATEPAIVEEEAREFLNRVAGHYGSECRQVRERVPPRPFPSIDRENLTGDHDDTVGLFPGDRESIRNLLGYYEAWGAVRIGSGREPEYAAFYETQSKGRQGAVRYVAEFKDIVPVEEFEANNLVKLSAEDWYAPDKKMVRVSNVRELEDPVPYRDELGSEAGKVPSLRYVTLDGLRNARGTDELLEDYRA